MHSTAWSKGLVERANQYLETSFLPGRAFTSPADFNAQLQAWIQVVNGRRRRALECAPTDRIGADRAAMLALPPVAPVTGWHTSLRLPRDHYVRLDGNDYSVHPAVIGHRVEVAADLERVQVFCDGRLVADHARSWARHQTFTDPVHAEAARALRHQHRALTAARALRPTVAPGDVQVEERSLSSYDTALGLVDTLVDTLVDGSAHEPAASASLPATGTSGTTEGTA